MMVDDPLFAGMFSSAVMLYGIIIPLLLLMAFGLLFIPSMLQSGAKAPAVGHALYCYCMEAIGVLLMTAGAIPTLASVLSGAPQEGGTYFALLVIFATGGIIFLWHDGMVREIENTSRAVPAIIFFTFFRFVGRLIVVLWTLSLVLSLIAGTAGQGEWVMPVVMIAYGALLAWCTRDVEDEAPVRAAPAPRPLVPRPATLIASKPAGSKKMQQRRK